MNVQIINETGLVRDTKVWVGNSEMKGILSISITKLSTDSDFITATIECMVEKVDIIADANH